MDKYSNIEGKTSNLDKGSYLQHEILTINNNVSENQNYYKNLLKEYQGLNKAQSPLSKKVKFNNKPKSIIMNNVNRGLLEQMAYPNVSQSLYRPNQTGSGKKLTEKLISDSAVNFDRKHIRSVSVPIFQEESRAISPSKNEKGFNINDLNYIKQKVAQDSQKSNNYTKSFQINKKTYGTDTLKDQMININETEAKPPPLSVKSQRKDDKIFIQDELHPQSFDQTLKIKNDIIPHKQKQKSRDFHCCLIY